MQTRASDGIEIVERRLAHQGCREAVLVRKCVSPSKI
jgi:hypothetical protein